MEPVITGVVMVAKAEIQGSRTVLREGAVRDAWGVRRQAAVDDVMAVVIGNNAV